MGGLQELGKVGKRLPLIFLIFTGQPRDYCGGRANASNTHTTHVDSPSDLPPVIISVFSLFYITGLLSCSSHTNLLSAKPRDSAFFSLSLDHPHFSLSSCLCHSVASHLFFDQGLHELLAPAFHIIFPYHQFHAKSKAKTNALERRMNQDRNSKFHN